MRKLHDPGFQRKRSPLIAAALEEHRPSIIRDLVYEGITFNDLTTRYGVTRKGLREALNLWGVIMPPCESLPCQRNWFLKKAECGIVVPTSLKRMNRSELVTMWQMWDENSLCAIFGVDHSTLSQTLAFHCIISAVRTTE